MSLLSSLVVMLVNSPGLPVGECVPPSSTMVFPETRVEVLDTNGAATLTGMSEAELERALAKNGAVFGAGPKLIFAMSGQKGRFEAVELQADDPVHLLSYAGAANPADASAPKGERKTSYEVIAAGDGFTVNVSEQVVAGQTVVAHETRSHWVERRDGKLRLMAALRCGLGERGEIPAPRWSVGERVDIKGCGGDIWFPRAQLEGCAVGEGGGARRASEYVDLANHVDFYDNPMHQARILRLALGTAGARTADEAKKHTGMWWHYGKALLGALKKGEPIDTWEVTNAFENAIASEILGIGRGYAAQLLGDTYVVMADKAGADAKAQKKGALELAVKSYERSQKLHKDKGTQEKLAEAKKQLKALR